MEFIKAKLHAFSLLKIKLFLSKGVNESVFVLCVNGRDFYIIGQQTSPYKKQILKFQIPFCQIQEENNNCVVFL